MDIEKLTKNKSKELGSEERIQITVKELVQRNKNRTFTDSEAIKKNVLLGNIFFSDKHPNIAFNFHPSFISLEEHSHNFVEIVYVYKGNCINRINYAETIEMQQGDLLILDIGSVHKIEVTDEDDIIVNCLLTKSYFTELANSFRNFLGILELRSTSYLYITSQKNYLIRSYFEKCIYEFFQNLPYSYISIQSYINLLFVELTRFKFEKQPEEFPLDKEIVYYMWENFENVTLTKMANHFNLSSTYLSRILKKKTKKNFLELLQDIRMEMAKKMLLNTDDKIEIISSNVGYQNSYYFTKLFKAKFGCLPSELRKSVYTAID